MVEANVSIPFYTTMLAALNPIFANQVFPQIAPDNQQAPFAVYQIIASAPSNTLNNGIPIENDLYQVDIYSTTFLEAQSLAASARAAVMAAKPNTVDRGMGRTLYESGVKSHRVVLEFSTWSN